MATELDLLSRVSYRGREITAPRLRGLLALLAGDLRTGASAGRLTEGLWPDEQPERPAKALQVLVSRARTQLGADVIASTPTGYRLALAEDQVDASAVLLSASASARHSRAGDHAAALAQAQTGLAFWQAPPPGDGELGDPVSALRAERALTYRSLVRSRALALSRLGRRDEAVDTLTDLVRERPRDEEVLLELLRCEAATAGPAAALARYDAYRRSLRDELGTDPGPALQAAYHELLRGSAPGVRRGVAHEPNPLLGRDGDIAAVADLLRTSRVTSIVGPGGLGKTRLANAVSRQADQPVVHLVGLAGVTADGEVAAEVASALGERRGGVIGQAGTHPVASDPVTGIATALGRGPALLVLDNCEHVIGGAADLVSALVSMTRDLRVLTTSRAPLGLSSESVYLLPELNLATTAELFAQRARAARPGVELPADAVEELCRHLDGLPLAAELAAARVRVMSVPEIAGRLADRFTLLRGGGRDTPERHRTLHAVVEWSWNLLEPAGRAAMRALSVFPGGFTAGAAERVLDGDAGTVLEHLVDQSLLKVTDTRSGVRFRMLETVREFSAAERDAAGETDQVTDGFLAWARDFGAAHHESIVGPEPYAPVRRVREEQDNLWLALRTGIARLDGATVAATSAVLGHLFTLESAYARMRSLAEETAWVLSHFRPPPDLVEVTRTALTMSIAYTFLIEGPRPLRTLVALRRLPPAPPDTLARAAALVIREAAGDAAGLYPLCDSDEPLVAGTANAVVTYLLEGQGDQDGALKAAERSVEACGRGGLPWLNGITLTRLAELYLQLERGDEVRRHLLAALPVYEQFEVWWDLAGLRWWMVLANLQLGDVDEAERWLEQAAPGQAGETPSLVTYGLAVRAEVLLARGEFDAGLRTWRRIVDLLRDDVDPSLRSFPAGMDPWTLEVKSVTVVAHVRHGQLDLVAELAGELPETLSRMLGEQDVKRPPFVLELPICGALLLALAAVELERAARTGDGYAVRWVARATALADRFRFLRTFHPTMSSAAARRAAQQADGPAYDDAVSSYADLSVDELRAAAVALLRERPA